MSHERTDTDRRLNGRTVLWVLLVLLFGGTGVAPAMLERAAIAIPNDAATFDLKEISVFDAPGAVKSRLVFGASVACQAEPDAKAGRYPTFQSAKPLYGSFLIGAAATEPNAGFRYQFAIDESAGSGRGYDRMYLDMNLNGDLTDDGFCGPMKSVPPKVLLQVGPGAAQVCFEPVKLRIAPGDDPSRRLEVLPRFLAYENGNRYATLVTTKARTGAIRIDGKEFNVVLGHSRSIPGWFDHPDTGICLLAAGDSRDDSASQWYGGDRLMAMHRSGDTYYRFSATPSGDKLFVWPYRGVFGTVELAAGRRNVRKVSLSGVLGSKDAAVSLTDCLGRPSLPSSGSSRLPVGDYSPLFVYFTYDATDYLILRNRHADGLPGGRPGQGPPIYSIRIREDKPFVLDFAGNPQVVFASPAANHRVKPGTDLEVKAVLTDPSLDVMFRRIRKGQQLDPKVVIKRSNGEIVAEGVMPFG